MASQRDLLGDKVSWDPPRAVRKTLKTLLTDLVVREYDPDGANGLRHDLFLSDRRDCYVSSARRMLCYLMREHSSLSYPVIGRMLGLDHASVMYGHKKVGRELLKDNPEYNPEVEYIAKTVGSDIARAVHNGDIMRTSLHPRYWKREDSQ